MYADGSHVTRLTNYPGYDSEPVWSPNGQKIAFVSDRSGRKEIYVMNADGSNVTRLTFSLSSKQSPAWSSDGSRIVYVDTHNADWPDYDTEIHWISVQGSDPIQLTNNGNSVDDLTPIWLNATMVLYASGDYPDFHLNIIHDDGINQMLLGEGINPTLSPDKTQLIYIGANYGISGEMFLVALDSLLTPLSDPFVLTLDNSDDPLFEPIILTPDTSGDYAPAWSPDGQRIVFVSERDGNAEIYVMNADSSNPIRLTYTAAAEQSPDWTP